MRGLNAAAGLVARRAELSGKLSADKAFCQSELVKLSAKASDSLRVHRKGTGLKRSSLRNGILVIIRKRRDFRGFGRRKADEASKKGARKRAVEMVLTSQKMPEEHRKASRKHQPISKREKVDRALVLKKHSPGGGEPCQ